jgi:hypothetical protein
MHILLDIGQQMLALSTASMHAHGNELHPRRIHSLRGIGGGWLRYSFWYDGRLEHRFVAPWFNALQAKGCGDTHAFNGQWCLGGSTLHCTMCGTDGT